MNKLTEDNRAQMDNRFSYHAPDDDKVAVHQLLRAWHKDVAEVIARHCPESQERHSALLKIEESLSWANAAVARYPSVSTKEEIGGTPE